ncbi:MAG: hypothetical protein IT302_03090 [Dehalococcoidia bacterium]|nr:hypothetical protein [Dehalococcoidia bacterium]
MIPASKLNRASTLATLPIMALVILFFSRADLGNRDIEPPSEGRLFVANLRGESLSLFDLTAPEQPEVARLALAGPPHELVAIDGRIYATLGRGQELVEVSPGATGILRALRLDGDPHGLAEGGGTLLVTLDRAKALVRVPLDSFAEAGREAAGDTPHAVATDGTGIFVTDSRDNRLRRIGPGGEVTFAETGALPESVAIVGEYVVTADADGGTVSIYRRADLSLAKRITVGGRPSRVAATGSAQVAVSLNAGARVAVIDLKGLRVKREVRVLPLPDGICTSPSNDYAAVTSNATNTVQYFTLPDWHAAGFRETGDGPGACAWLP